MSDNAQKRILAILYDIERGRDDGATAVTPIELATQQVNAHFKRSYSPTLVGLYLKTLIGTGFVTMSEQGYQLTPIGLDQGQAAWERRCRLGYTAMLEAETLPRGKRPPHPAIHHLSAANG